MEHNHQDKFWYRPTLIIILALILLAELVFIGQVLLVGRQESFIASVVPEALVSLTNEVRYPSNLPPLLASPLLNQAAGLKAADMAQRGYFAHVSPSGESPWSWFDRVGYRYKYAGENLAVNFIDSREVMEAWLASPGHRANIISSRYNEVGIGLAVGEYKGRRAVFVAQFFGRQTRAAVEEIGRSGAAAAVSVGFGPWLTSPKTLNRVVLGALALLLIILLALKIFVKPAVQYIKMVVLGLALVLIIALLLWFNQTYFSAPLEISLLT